MVKFFVLMMGVAVSLAGNGVPPALQVAEIPSPAGAGSRSMALAAGVDGVVWLVWFEPVDSVLALRFAAFDAAKGHWGGARTIAAGASFGDVGDDLPSFTESGTGHLTAAWPTHDPNPMTKVSQSEDGGLTWSSPVALSRESPITGYAALATLADGRVLAAWLDGRARREGGRGLYL